MFLEINLAKKNKKQKKQFPTIFIVNFVLKGRDRDVHKAREDEKGRLYDFVEFFGTKVFKIYFYTFYNLLKSHWAFEEYFSDSKILQNMIYLFSYVHENLEDKLKIEQWQKYLQSQFSRTHRVVFP